jgi:importin subunit beta-1
MMDLIRRTLEDEDKTEAALKLAIGLVGDLADTFPTGEIKEFLLADWVALALKNKSRVSSESRKTMRWAREVRMSAKLQNLLCSWVHKQMVKRATA